MTSKVGWRGAASALAVVLMAASSAAGAAPSSAAAGGGGGRPCRAAVVALPGLGGSFAEGQAFNQRGVFVGAAGTSGDRDVRAVSWYRGQLRVIETGLVEDEAYSVNDRGQIVGSGRVPDSDVFASWTRVDGQVHRLQGLGGSTFVDTVNSSGVIVGAADDTDGRLKPLRWRNWSSAPERLPLLPGDQWGFVGGLNDRGVMVGASVGDDIFHPVVWDRRGVVRRLPLGPAGQLDWGFANTISRSGFITGALSTPGDAPQDAVRWDGDRVTDLGRLLPDDQVSEGEGISDRGFVVGRSDRYTEQGRASRHVIFWPGSGPLLSLPSLAKDWNTSESRAFAIDERGTVAGYSTDDAGTTRATVWTCAQRQAFRPAQVPPPSTTPGARTRSKSVDAFHARTARGVIEDRR